MVKKETIKEKKKIVFAHWNSKGIVVHKRMTHDIGLEIGKALRDYPVEELNEIIDFYSTILELGTPDHEKIYYWTYKWGLYEFLKRGVRKFDGQALSNYLRKQRINTPEAIIFKRK